ncbi:MAG: hypothetical protein HZA50_07420 [Planctomycetes bacterium]|nr:hypothetical protein [Planctomycetota bacterium]
MKRLADLFASPLAEYRPVPQWSWNGDMTEARITEQLEQFAAQGCGGLFAHARSGHITGYLTDRWFDLWDFAVKEARRLGLNFHIYDEFICPAGVAGGNTMAEDPTLAQREVNLVPFSAGRQHGEVLLPLRISGDGRAEIVEKDADATHAVVMSSGGGRNAPDMLNPQTTRTFIRLTHERYRKKCGEAFGRDVIYMFSDEPMILASRAGLPFSRRLQRDFLQDHGYALEGEKLLSLCLTREDSPQVRFDFWRTVNRLFNECFMKPIHDWCGENRLLFTGHLMEHEWPSPSLTPDNMANLRWMHAPGEDLLGFQFSPTRPADNGMWLMNLKELSSLASQLGRSKSMVETCGARGYHTAFEHFKPCEDFTLSFGVNIIDPHLAHQTLSGIGKYDWPQTMTDHSPWWNYYRAHADHVARANTAISQGVERNRILLLMPTTTGWMHYTGSGFDEAGGQTWKNKLEWMRNTQIGLVMDMYAGQFDFDLGDEFILEEFARPEDRRLVVGERTYEAVVIPQAMENLTASTLKLLRACLEKGLPVYSLAVPGYVDGRPSREPADLAKAAGWKQFADAGALLRELRRQISPYLARPDGGAIAGGLVWRRAVGSEGTIWFFCNPWAEPIVADICVAGASAARLDTARGTMEVHPVERDGKSIRIKLNLLPRGHELLLVSDSPEIAGAAPRRTAPRRTPVELAPRSIQRMRPNLLYVDYGDLEAYGRERRDVNTAAADTQNWRWQGFDGNPWGKQFRRTLVDRPEDKDTGFAFTYRFTIGKDVSRTTLDSLRVGIERPWLYRIDLNGSAIEPSCGERWFDEDMRSFAIGQAARPGENALTITARPFHILCNIMPIYVIGDFSLTPADRGFAIVNPAIPAMGDWTAQGMPFYPDRVRYEYAFSLPNQAGGLVGRIPSWEGSAAVVLLDGREIAPVMHPPYECEIPGPIKAGGHALAVDILGNMRNMMGSHHIDKHPLRWTYECGPANMPPGKNYRLDPTGLFVKPELFAT